MPHNVTEAAVFTAVVPVPDPGEPIMAAGLEAVAEALGNRTQALALKGLRTLPVCAVRRDGEWIWRVLSSTTPAYTSTSAPGVGANVINEDHLFFPVPQKLYGTTITSYGIRIKPTSAHGATLPTNQMSVGLVQGNSVISSVFDSQPNEGAYEAEHDLIKSPVSHVLSPTGAPYYIVAANEFGGAGAIATNNQVLYAFVTTEEP